ncbi:hypothetical protein BFJ66_g11066 [Fusarium oxysporum f. sp. cepae]|uniref:Uncharacterized protein n=1 Tax=Fusarium oxysporum f. sp. cepae TaxID=396571 RepID=A0A3L6P3I9_FUSOX|nr:hypothetical protein BFJ65_g3922 [Fusarium oxysporum f. sp. cepae]RKK33187.1 hypothetical protein BFJ67_g14368 [Fusarium oxysporum f. sp. cepae]RKK41320.1 hypothetical protein BFJ66_g11066 [Fusarium oxysporum f. sp. cepae]
MLGSFLMSCPGAADVFQGDMDRYQQSVEHQSPGMQKVISRIKENFAKVTKDMSVFLANNLARYVRFEIRSLSTSVVAHITLCSVYRATLAEAPGSNRINYPAWFFLACVYGPDHKKLRPYRDYNGSEERQEILFIAESVPGSHGRSEAVSEVKPEAEDSSIRDLAICRPSKPPPPTRTTRGATMEKRLADLEKQLLGIRRVQKRQAELMEKELKSIHKRVKALKADREQIELDREEAEVELASYELVARDVNTDDGDVKDEVD